MKTFQQFQEEVKVPPVKGLGGGGGGTDSITDKSQSKSLKKRIGDFFLYGDSFLRLFAPVFEVWEKSP